MSRPLKKYPYVVYYKDQTYQTIDLLKADFNAIADAVMAEKRVVKISIGLMELTDIRSIFERVEPVENKAPETQEDVSTLYPNLTLEESAFIWANIQEQNELKRRKEREMEELQ